MSKINGQTSSTVFNLDDMKTGENQSASETVSEREMLMSRSPHVSSSTAYKLRTAILVISWISVVYLGAMGVLVFVMAFIKGNSTAFAFSLDALLDCASSAVVIWRYWGSAASLYSGKRETIACIVLGTLFIASFISICTRSILSLVSHEHRRRSYTLWVISLINVVSCFGFMLSKAILAKKLESITIATDAVNSGIGLIIALSAVATDIIYNNNASTWFVDPLIGMICAVFLFAYGLWVIVYHTCLLNSKGAG